MTDVLGKYCEYQNFSSNRLRVWSLVVTIFGDAIEPRGGVFRLGALQQITERIGIESNALRTAMSRLASDGWLERQRIGRASYYRPSKTASRENALACRVIYRFFPENWNGNWIFALSTNSEGFGADAKEKLHGGNFVFHSRKLAIAPDVGSSNGPINIQGVCILNASSPAISDAEDILRNVDFHYDCTGLYGEFVKSATALLTNTENLDEIDGLDAVVLRSLLVHNWRRIVLRDVHWPRELRPKNWPGFAAQTIMRTLYHRFLNPSEEWLTGLDATPNGKLPEAGPELAHRFSN